MSRAPSPRASRSRSFCPPARRALLSALARALVAFAVACALTACQHRATESRPRGTRGEPTATRLVSLDPATTEAIYALGAGRLLVGRSRYSDYPPEALAAPAVGGYVDASLEAIVALRPTLVVGTQGPAGRAFADQITAMGIETYFPRTESMSEIDAMLLGLADRIGLSPRARTLVTKLRADRDAIARATASEPRPRVLLVFGNAPLVVAGPDGFANEVLLLAGATNAVTAGGAYPALNLERLMAVDPDVIIDATSPAAPDLEPIGLHDPEWRDLSAVKNGRLFAIRDDALLRPGPRIAEGLRTLAAHLHPGIAVPAAAPLGTPSAPPALSAPSAHSAPR